MKKEKILIVDDEEYIRKLIRRSLSNDDYLLEEAACSSSALTLLKDQSFDLIILDVMLGNEDGFELIKEIKNLGIRTPIILVSGRGEDYYKILGLGIGADNYITKPFQPAILCAHVKAHLRSYKEYNKMPSASSHFLLQGPFKFDLTSYKFYKNEDVIDLSYKESLLIKFFMENPQQVFTKQQLYEKIWNEIIVDDNAIMVYIHNLRKKIEICHKSPKHIITVWGIGYKFLP